MREVKRSGESHDKLIEKLAQLEGEVKRLHDAREAEAELAAERERGTGKGRAFEQQAFELVEAMAAARGDVAHHVGDERSASGGKQGDIVIEIDAASGPAKGAHRDRREGREALEEPRLGDAQRRARRARRRLRDPASSPPTRRCPPGASRCTSTRATR